MLLNKQSNEGMEFLPFNMLEVQINSDESNADKEQQ